MRKLLIYIFLFLSALSVEGHSGKARFHVIIDTDGAADDLRAICMMLGNRELEVLAVTTSEGALSSKSAAMKVTSLLRDFYHEGIPVGTGRDFGIKPIWRSQSEQINWGDTTNTGVSWTPAKDLIISTLEEEDEKVVFICLGSLTNLNDVLSAKPQLKERIDKVLWYNDSVNPLSGANYEADKTSADKVLKSGVNISIISGGEKISVDKSYIDLFSNIDNQYSRKIVDTHSKGVLKPIVDVAHMKAWDDLVAVYLFVPEIFTSSRISQSVTFNTISGEQELDKARETIVAILTGKPDSESRVFYGFPESPDLYAADVIPVMKSIISRHGRSEWRAGVLANELHGHLGIYAIVGVKMGIRAREYFNIGVDDIVVVSYAGLQPPVSCMNDGLQVSTGATIGHGLISVAQGEPIRPEASFSFKGKTISLRLKPAFAMQIRNDVEEGIRLHGNLTEDYWNYIRELAIKYWHDFDRHEIFEMKF